MTLYDLRSQQISSHRIRMETFDQPGSHFIMNEREDQYSVNCSPDVYLSRPLAVNDINQTIFCKMAQNPEPPASNSTEDIDKLDLDQMNLTETTKRDYNANDVIIAYSASDARAWHPLSPELTTLFEGWTTFSWEFPLDRPGFTSALTSIKFTPYISGAHQRGCISRDKPENIIPLQYSTVLKNLEVLQQHGADDGEVFNDMDAPASFVDIAFQELYEAVRASYDMPPKLPSDAILMYSIHLAATV